MLKSDYTEWSDADLNKVNKAYRIQLQNKRTQIVNEKLILFKPILANDRHVMLIIVPNLLRRTIFIHYHAGPSGGHMGEYETLYRIGLRFFWP